MKKECVDEKETTYLLSQNIIDLINEREEKADYIDYDENLWDTL